MNHEAIITLTASLYIIDTGITRLGGLSHLVSVSPLYIVGTAMTGLERSLHFLSGLASSVK